CGRLPRPMKIYRQMARITSFAHVPNEPAGGGPAHDRCSTRAVRRARSPGLVLYSAEPRPVCSPVHLMDARRPFAGLGEACLVCRGREYMDQVQYFCTPWLTTRMASGGVRCRAVRNLR